MALVDGREFVIVMDVLIIIVCQMVMAIFALVELPRAKVATLYKGEVNVNFYLWVYTSLLSK